MFKKLKGALGGGGSAKGGVKVKFDLQVVHCERLPSAVKKCRVVWSRSAKVQMTAVKDVRNGMAVFKQTLTQIGAVNKDKQGEYEAKEYVIKVQAPEGNTENMVTIGKVNLDLAQYVMDTTNQQTEMVPITYKVGSSSNGFIKLVINTTVLGDVADDAMTEVSGITGLTSQDGNREEQDLDGFEHESPARSKSLKGSGNSASQASRAGRGGKAPLPTTREDTEDDNSSEEDSAPAARRQAGGASSSRGASADPFAKRVPGAPPPKPPPKPVWDDDISPVASDLSDGEDARPRAKAEASKKVDLNEAAQRQKDKPKEDLTDLKSSLFGGSKKKDSGASSSTAAKPGGKGAAPPPPVDNEDDARAALFAAPSKPKAAAAGGSGKAAAGAKGGKAAPPPGDESEEDAARAALFAAPAKPAKTSAKPLPPMPAEDGDEDAARAALFSTSSSKKPAAAGASGTKGGKGASQPARRPVETDESEEDAPPPAKAPAAAKGRGNTAAASSKASTSARDAFDDEPAFPSASTKGSAADDSKTLRRGNSKASAPTTRAPAPANHSDEDHSEDERDALGIGGGAKGRGGAPAGRSGASPAGGGDSRQVLAENDKLRAQVAQLQSQLDKATKQIRELEEQLAEADMAGLFQQMQQMETAHNEEKKRWEASKAQEIKTLRQEYEHELSELEAQVEELRGSSRPGKGGAALAEREAQLEKLEAEARQKLAEAERMVDESMMAAVKQQQERKALQDEVEKLRAAQSSGSKAKGGRGRGGYDSEEDEEDSLLVHELREQIAELERKNEALQKASVAAQQEAASLSDTVARMLRDTGLAIPRTQGGELAVCAAAFTMLCEELHHTEVQLTKARDESHRNAEAQATLMELQTHSHRLQDDLDAMSSQYAALQQELEHVTHQLHAAAATPSTHPDTTPYAAAGAVGGGAAAAAVLTELQQLRDERITLQTQLQEAQYELRQARNSERSNLQGLQAEADALRAALAAAEARTAQLQMDSAAEVEALEAESRRLEAANERLEAQLAELSARDGGAAAGDAAPLAAQVAALQHEKAELEAKLVEFNEAEAIIKEWSDYADALTAEKQQLEEQIAALTSERDALSAAHAGADSQAVALAQQVQDLQAQNAQLLAGQAAVSGSYLPRPGAARATAPRVSGGGGASAQELQASKRQVADLEADNADLRHATVSLRAENDQLRQQVAQLQAQVAEIHELRTQVQELLPMAIAHAEQQEQASARKSTSRGPSASGKRFTDAGSDNVSVLSWSEQRERLQSENDALKAEVAGLRAALATARAAPTGRGGASLGAGGRGYNGSDDALSHSPEGSVGSSRTSSASGAADERHLSGARAGSSRRPQWSPGAQQPLLARDKYDVTQMSPAELARELSALQERHAASEAEMVALRAAMARAPLLADRAERSDSDAALNQQQPLPSMSDAAGAGPNSDSSLADKVGLLSAWRAQAEQTLASLQAQHSNLKLDHTEALSQAEELRKRLADRDTSIQQLKSQIERLTLELQQSKELKRPANADVIQTRLTHDDAPSSPMVNTPTSAAVAAAAATARRDTVGAVWHGGSRPARESGSTVASSVTSDAGRRRTASGATCDEPMLLPPPPAAALPTTASGSVSLDTETGRLIARLQTAAAAVNITRRAVASCMSVISVQEPIDVSEDMALDVALICMKDEAYGLFQELKRQAREAPRYEAQVQALSQAVVELEAQVHELQQENQVLAGLHPAFGATAAAGATGGGGIRYRATTLSTGVSTPDGGMYPCSPDRGGLGRLSEDTAAAAAGGGGGGGAAMTSNPLYADDAGLALSAMEQQLALAEQQRVEAVRSAETLERDNVRLRQDVERLETELSSLGSSTGYKAASASGTTSRNARPGRKPARAASSDEEDSDGETPNARNALAARRANQAAGSRSLPPEVSKELDTLRDRCAKLERLCDDLEHRAAEERTQYESRLAQAMEDTQAAQREALEAVARAKQGADEELQAGGDSAALRRQIVDLEVQVSSLSRENVSLAEQLDEERTARETLEKQIKRGLKNMGEDELLETVEAFESKYLRLKERHRKHEAAAADEIDHLTQQLLEAQHAAEQAQAAAAASAGKGARGAAPPPPAAAAAPREVAELRRENDVLIGQLVAKQMEVAQLAEEQAMLKRDLFRAKEVNMKLAAKMTSLEAHAYDKSTIQSPAASIKSAPSKGGGLFGRRRRATEDD